MTIRKVPFSKLIRTTDICPTQWEYISDDGIGYYIRYRHYKLTVYISKNKINDILDCIETENMVLSITIAMKYLSDNDLLEILTKYNLLED